MNPALASDERVSPDLVELSADHPGLNDPEYRRRRNEIARAAMDYGGSGPVPGVAYTEEEQSVWRSVWAHLEPLHARYACRAYADAAGRIDLARDRIPQLDEVNRRIEPMHGFRMVPVAGLVSAGAFLRTLGAGVFLSTQYMRHHSVPLYTPEPDVVHELIGHAATFTHAPFSALNRAFGQAALRAGSETIEKIGRLYWYTLEFGVVREESALKVYGAGLLSSSGELGRFETEEGLEEWDVDRIVATPYDPTRYQQRLFVAPSFDAMTRDVTTWLDAV